MSTKYEIIYEATPNPNSMKFTITIPIADETAFFDDPLQTNRSPLAQKLFGFPWMQAVYIGPNFVTITKQDWVDWKVLADPLSDLIVEHLERGEGVLLPASEFQMDASDLQNKIGKTANLDESSSNQNSIEILDTDSPIIRKIKEILNRDIRPAVAMDGGDIAFYKYENQRLYLRMQGACNGCPSAAITLKDGIEVRMKAAIPEIIEVISI